MTRTKHFFGYSHPSNGSGLPCKTTDGCVAAMDLDAEGGALAAGPSNAGGSSGAGSSRAVTAAVPEAAGMCLYLSEIKEWMVEFSCDMIFIAVRTDCAWYRIRSVTAAYAPWFDTVLKCARLAIHILSMITQEKRSSRLSFADAIKDLADQNASKPTFISSKIAVRTSQHVHRLLISTTS